MLTTNSRFTVAPDVCSGSSSDGTTILHLRDGVLYSVIGVGSLIWIKLTAQPGGLTLNEIVCALREEFADISEERLRCDAEKLLTQLTQKGIVQLQDKKVVGFRKLTEGQLNSVTGFVARLVVTGFLRLRLIACAAFVELILLDLTLTIGGFKAMHRLVKRWPMTDKTDASPERLKQICRAVDRAITRYPKHALCLQRSAVTACLLRSYGVPAQMVIACRKTPFEGHAWVELDDVVINDTQKVKPFYSSVLVRC